MLLLVHQGKDCTGWCAAVEKEKLALNVRTQDQTRLYMATTMKLISLPCHLSDTVRLILGYNSMSIISVVQSDQM